MALAKIGSLISSGVAGLVVGAVLGLVLSVIFEDRLKELLKRIERRCRRLARKTRPAHEREYFEFGNVRSRCIIVEGDGSHPINEALVHTVVSDEPITLPPEMLEWKDEIALAENGKPKDDPDRKWNGPVFGVERLGVQRTEFAEEPELYFRLRRSDYFSFQATQYLDRRFRDGTTPRSKYIDSVGHRAAPAFMSLSLGTSVVLVTTDDKVLLCQRTATVGSRPLHWGVSADEGTHPVHDCPGGAPPRMYDVARRGVREELSLEPEEYRLEMLAVTIDTERHQWDTVFVGYTHELSAENLESRIRRGAKDKDIEIADLEFIDFEVSPVLAWLSSCGPSRLSTPILLVALYLALVRRHGRYYVERAGRRFSKGRGPAEQKS